MKPQTIILATANPNKAREFEALMEGIHIKATPPAFTLPPETGATFYENARLKVLAVRKQFRELADAAESGAGLPWIMADDSGIEVEALKGKPGVYSARYAGEDATDADNVNKLLDELAGQENRRARFVCEIVCVSPQGRELRATGVVNGSIAAAPRGAAGFGYDPVFIPDGYSLTVSQLPAEEKNRISHRARAAHSLLVQLGGGKGQ